MGSKLKGNPTLNDKTLCALVGIYSEKDKPLFVNKIKAFSKLSSFKEAVKIAAKGEEANGTQNRHLHWLWSASRIKYLNRAADILTNKTAQLKRCRDFQELHQLITCYVSHISWIKKVYCYDAALRIGAWKEFWPQKVHVHAAAVKKAASELKLKINGDTVEAKTLPLPLHCLK